MGNSTAAAAASLDSGLQSVQNDRFKLSTTRKTVYPMSETWLRPNRRALWFGCIPPLVIGAVGAWIAIQQTGAPWWQWIGIAWIVLAILAIVAVLHQLSRPRIAYHDGQILFNLQAGPPLAVPVEFVEAFFLGQGPAHLPAGIAKQEKSVNLVARLSQRETQWAQREVKPALGNWSEGYVTIRGTWCEPLGPELIRKLNRRLKEVKTLGPEENSDNASD
jgi:hypothetical protein